MRIILYTGKGGVGKTTVAAATALRAAEMGYRTIVFSTDIAHSLGDSLDFPLTPDPIQVAPNLWGQEVDILKELETYWSTIQNWIRSVMVWRGLQEIIAEEMAVLPGTEELCSLLYIAHHHDSGQYDVVVVDCAPTGETLRLLSFPEVARWWMERIFPLERKVARLVRPVIKPFVDIPIPEDEVFDAIHKLFSQLVRIRTILTKPGDASVRLVLNPEKMVIKEAQRTLTYLNLYGYDTDLVVCNRVIPEDVQDRYFDAWKESQIRHLQTIEESFSPLPIRNIPLMKQEVVGLPLLREIARSLFGDDDPSGIFYRGKPHRIQKEGGHYVLSLPLPFVTKEQVSLVQSGDALVVQAGSHRRNILLPRVLIGRPVQEARYEDNQLKIHFQGKAGQKK